MSVNELHEENDKPKSRKTAAAKEPADIEWNSPVYIAGEKNWLWFVMFSVVAAALFVFAIWTGTWTFVAALAVSLVALILYFLSPNPKLRHTLDKGALYISGKRFEYGKFKAFGLLEDGGRDCVVLIPKAKLAPGMIVYFPKKHKKDIAEKLSVHLPMQDVKWDLIEKLTRKLKL